MGFYERLQGFIQDGTLPPKPATMIRLMYEGYEQLARDRGLPLPPLEDLLITYLEMTREQCIAPVSFEPFHQRQRSPIDYYQFGLDLIRPLIDPTTSVLKDEANLNAIMASLEAGDNVILLANHQTESDPQILSLLLEHKYPRLALEMIFIAGDRVVTDPVAVPVSLGCNLLCIYSKKHIDTPPEKKGEKQQHNQKTMKLMSQLLSEGGKCIFVAPSGGRDRRNKEGVIEVAPFDPSSVEMFRLMAERSLRPTHFHTLALSTFDLLPPPDVVEQEIGEMRTVGYGSAKAYFGPKIDFQPIESTSISLGRQGRRQAVAEMVWKLVKQDYDSLA